jgi:TM2 domain-containing membrane protein YozV
MARDDRDDDLDSRRERRPATQESKRIVAGILGILLGSLGIHKFYLGYTTPGIIQLVLGICTGGIAGIIGLVEGIIYLTKSDEEFIETYQVGKKEWF